MLALLLALAHQGVTPLPNAHAHNDYAHPRPLLDALDRGFTSVEADIFLTGKGELLVGHFAFELRAGRTLESLYLEPLRRRARAGKGAIYPPAGGGGGGGDKSPPFYLLIDIKTDGPKTYAALDRVLAKYADILSETRDGKHTRRAVTAVISGNCPRADIVRQKVRYAGIDGRPGDLDSTAPAHLVPFVSASWGSQFRWRGDGAMPEAERKKLAEFVAKAHKGGRLVRFWATPEKLPLWRQLRSAGVDLINTDKLDELKAFLLKERVPDERR